jgi:hypothetical protein
LFKMGCVFCATRSKRLRNMILAYNSVTGTGMHRDARERWLSSHGNGN